MADVFISYARADEATARRLASVLGSTGLDVWWDAELPAHRAYSEIIESKLEQARAVVVLWSAAAAKSQWVRAEADFARNAGKLVQAQLDGALPPMPFNQIQCADLKGWRGSRHHNGWSKLEASVKALVSGEEQAPAAPGRGSLRASHQPYRWAAAAVAALLVALGIYLYAFATAGEEHRPVLAVLPFRSVDAGDASLVAGMWEDTRTAIGRNPQLIVLGPNTAQQLADEGEAATRKAADYLLEASVRTAGDRIRVSTALVRTADGSQIWSEDFDRKLNDVFALQSEIASEIEGRIRGRLAENGGVTPEHIATSGDAYALYSDARAKIRKRDSELSVAAYQELRQVLRMDPNFAPAWATLAQVVGQIPASEKGWKLSDPAEAYARKAVELAPNLGAAHAALAYALKLRGPVAYAEVERAVALDPSDYEAVNWLGNMRQTAGDSRGALQAYSRAAELEPYFWPAVINMYSMLSDAGDQDGIRKLVDKERSVGADRLTALIEMSRAQDTGDLAAAASIGIRSWIGGRHEDQPAIGQSLWLVLLQLGFDDEAMHLGPGPEFAPFLLKNDPKGLDMMESHRMEASTFFKLEPLSENAGRVYLLSGRGQKLAQMYRSLEMEAGPFRQMVAEEGPQHFLYSAPLIALALKQNGHADQANALLSLAESDAREGLRDGKPLSSVLLSRVYAVEGRNDEALSLLGAAIARGWLPQPPEMLRDLSEDPALEGLKDDPRFASARDQVLQTIARQRDHVDPRLIAQLRAA